MQFSADAALQRLVDHLVLADPGLALEAAVTTPGGIVIAVPARSFTSTRASGNASRIIVSISVCDMAMTVVLPDDFFRLVLFPGLGLEPGHDILGGLAGGDRDARRS